MCLPADYRNLLRPSSAPKPIHPLYGVVVYTYKVLNTNLCWIIRIYDLESKFSSPFPKNSGTALQPFAFEGKRLMLYKLSYFGIAHVSLVSAQFVKLFSVYSGFANIRTLVTSFAKNGPCANFATSSIIWFFKLDTYSNARPLPDLQYCLKAILMQGQRSTNWSKGPVSQTI